MEYPLVILKGILLRLTSTVHVVTSIVSIVWYVFPSWKLKGFRSK